MDNSLQEISVKECISYGWTTFKQRAGLFIGAGVILLIIDFILNSPRSSHTAQQTLEESLLYAVLSVVAFALSLLVSMGKIHFFLRSTDDLEHTSLRDLWNPHPYWKFVGTTILAGLITIIGFILFIIPGIILGIMVGFSTYLVIDKDLGPIQALKESARLTKGNRWNLCLLGLAIVGINIVGFCIFIVGLFVTLPVSTLAVLHAYRKLSGSTGKDSIVTTSSPLPIEAEPII